PRLRPRPPRALRRDRISPCARRLRDLDRWPHPRGRGCVCRTHVTTRVSRSDARDRSPRAFTRERRLAAGLDGVRRVADGNSREVGNTPGLVARRLLVCEIVELRERLQASIGKEYEVGSELGGGVQSRVYAARDTELDRPVVIKVLPPELAAGEGLE